MERVHKKEEQKQVTDQVMSSVQMAKVMENQANIRMNGLQKGNYTDVVRYISSQKAESSKILKHPITSSDNVVQRS